MVPPAIKIIEVNAKVIMKAIIISAFGEGQTTTEDFSYISLNGGVLKAAVGDWAKSKVGGPYENEKISELTGVNSKALLEGGQAGAAIAKETIMTSDKTGYELIDLINHRIKEAYQKLELKDYSKHREKAFTGYIGHILATPEKIIITAVGDVRIAVDGKLIAGKTKKVDKHNANLRREYILKTGDWKNSYKNVSEQNILNQYQYQNNPGHEFSYPAIDGTLTKPKGEIHVIEIGKPSRILIWSDGYVTPEKSEDFSIEGLESMLERVYQEDPRRYKKYPAIEYLKGDRTAIEITGLDDWTKLEVQHIKIESK